MQSTEGVFSGLAPDDLVFPADVFSLAFHPHRDFIACGLITGTITAFGYSVDENAQMASYSYHSGSCRALCFTPDGNFLLSASQDQTVGVIDCNTGQLAMHISPAHDAPLYSMLHFYFGNHELLATGDDDGVIKVWDVRSRVEAMRFEEHEDFISCFARKSPDDPMLISAGGDGYLGVFDLRGRGSLEAFSDNMEDELLSLAVLKNGRKVVTGTAEGVLAIFSWDKWGDMSDRFPGHPGSVDSMVTIDESTVATGSSDGMIRLVSILPNKLIGVVGEHREFPIEQLALSRDRIYLGSCSHDCTVKFWNIKELYEEDHDGHLPENVESIGREDGAPEAAAGSELDDANADDDSSSEAERKPLTSTSSSSSSSRRTEVPTMQSKRKKKKKAFFKDL